MVAHVAAARGGHKGLQAGRKGRKKGFCRYFGGICQLHFHQLIVNLLDGRRGAVVFHEGRLRMVDHGKNCRFQAAVMNGIDLADNVLKGALDQGRIFGRFFCGRQGGKGAGSDFQSFSGFLGSRGLEGEMERRAPAALPAASFRKVLLEIGSFIMDSLIDSSSSNDRSGGPLTIKAGLQMTGRGKSGKEGISCFPLSVSVVCKEDNRGWKNKDKDRQIFVNLQKFGRI